jgi:hypothetical protein
VGWDLLPRVRGSMALFMFLTTGSCLSAFGLLAEVLVVDLNSDTLIFILFFEIETSVRWLRRCITES